MHISKGFLAFLTTRMVGVPHFSHALPSGTIFASCGRGYVALQSG
jgi:hypothetical protein